MKECHFKRDVKENPIDIDDSLKEDKTYPSTTNVKNVSHKSQDFKSTMESEAKRNKPKKLQADKKGKRI